MAPPAEGAYFAAALDLRAFGLARADTLCAAIPNGPEAAVCFWAFSAQCVYAPLNPALTAAEIDFELADLPAHALVVMRDAAAGAAAASRITTSCLLYTSPSPRDA